jgi:recombination protein RecR
MEFSSKLLQSAVDEVAQLPGIGRRTALRLVLHLMRQPESQTLHLTEALQKMRQNINFCKNCHNISDSELCEICVNTNRNQQVVCVVEDIRDVMAIESTASYRGVYHVLGGKISPMDGIGPHDLKINSLIEKVRSGTIKDMEVVISTIARGISVGDELEYADEVTLGRSITNRIPFELSFKS